MKKIYLTLLTTIALAGHAMAQTNIFPNDGAVGIGVTTGLSGMLTVKQNTELGPFTGNSIALANVTATAGTSDLVSQRLWLVRDVSGTTSNFARFHDALTINSTYNAPRVTTRTWWERDPFDDVQAWGTGENTYFSITNGRVGIGTGTVSQNNKFTIDNSATTETVAAASTNSLMRLVGTPSFTDNTSSYRIWSSTVTGKGSSSAKELNSMMINNDNNMASGTVVESQTGVYSNVRLIGAGSALNAFGFRSSVSTSTVSTGSLTGYYRGFFASSPAVAGTGTMNNVYGVYVDQQKVTGVTAGYGIYQAGSPDINYLAGKTGIGTNAPTSTLDINNVAAMPTVQLRALSTNDPARMEQFILQDNVTDYTIGRGTTDPTWFSRTLNLNVPNVSSYTNSITLLPKITFTSTNPTGNVAGGVLLGSVESNTGNWYMKGNVGIGTTTPAEALSVNGNIRAKQVKVDINGWPDYVFSDTYKLASLNEVSTFIDKNHHLPDMPSEADVNKAGLDLGDMNARLLKKVEELTLYLIQQNKEMEVLKKKVNELSK